ncbi:unnamed protein product [Pedinophyceae sp. YPF-701]|nr:unnamed protein product [Pedinophyceae sp. YPF-701]
MRSIKTMSSHAYEKGVVIAKCPGCQNLHVIADRLGWFGEPGSIEDYLKERGESVYRGAAGDIEITPEALAGWKMPKARNSAAKPSS